MSPAPPAPTGKNRPRGAASHTGLLVAAVAKAEASLASGARARGSTSRLAPGAWRRAVAAAAARAARASLVAAERAIAGGREKGVWVVV
jgi:hypothetical protein